MLLDVPIVEMELLLHFSNQLLRLNRGVMVRLLGVNLLPLWPKWSFGILLK
jgi:hypothetical protein